MSKYENRVKQINRTDQFKRPKSMLKEDDMSQEWQDKIIDWVTFYRRNVHRFVEHYFGIRLHDYQKLWLYYMSTRDAFITIGARAGAKSWMIAVYALARAVLYPGSEIVVVATTKQQAGIIFGKIESLKNDFPNIAREIKDFTNTSNVWKCVLHSGSMIKVVACNDGGRGNRSTFTIYEEFRIMDKTKVDQVVRPFAIQRQPPFLKNPKYARLIEDYTECMISSAYHKSEWWYKETIDIIKQQLKGANVGFFAFDYLIAIKHGIKTWKMINSDKIRMDEITFLEEYENIPWGENSKSMFKLELFTKCQTLKQAFYPQNNDRYNPRKNPFDIAKVDGEIRLLSVDIATRAGKTNDNTIISCARLIPTHRGYQRELVYMESLNGENTILQALRIKQIFNDFSADFVVLDIQNAGIAVFDALSQITKDDERGIEYEPWTVMIHEAIPDTIYTELTEKVIGLNPTPIVFPISATAKLNSDIAYSFRDKLQKKMWSFLFSPMDADEYLTKKFKKEYLKDSVDGVNERVWMLHPYAQTAEMINECVSSEMIMLNGYAKIKEMSGKRKDRYTSVSYLNYVASFFDAELIKETKPEDALDFLMQYIYN